MDKEQLVRPVAGVDSSAVSASVLGEGWRILTLQVSADIYRLYIDGSLADGFDVSRGDFHAATSDHDPADAAWWALVNVVSPTSKMVLGARSSGASAFDRGFFHGDIGEMVVYKQLLSDAQRVIVSRALCSRWRGARCDPPSFAGNFLFSWLGVSGLSLAENGATPKGRIQRLSGSDGYAKIRFRTANGTALDGVHFTSLPGSVDWKHGDSSERVIDVVRLLGGRGFVGDAPGGIDLVGRRFTVVLDTGRSFEAPFIAADAEILIVNDVPGVAAAVPRSTPTGGGSQVTIEGFHFGKSDAAGFVLP